MMAVRSTAAAEFIRERPSKPSVVSCSIVLRQDSR
jgi:hypothetical protein